MPTDDVCDAELNPAGRSNIIFDANSNLNAAVSDRDGTQGLDCVSANDPRVPAEPVGMGKDGITEVHQFMKYTDRYAPIPIASGAEARLTEAEADLQAGEGSGLSLLNSRRSVAIDPPPETLEDPGSPDARVDLLFRERAFRLFATGHRRGDLRRLM